MPAASGIHLVDEVLRQFSKDALQTVTGASANNVTLGPLDRDGDGLRINWFCYKIDPHPGFRNMEHPSTGWTTSRGKPPVALMLHYLLSVFPDSSTTGNPIEIAHDALAAVMQHVHGTNMIVGPDHPMMTVLFGGQHPHLVEPLRISMEPLDLEALSKIWTASTKPMRTSVGYLVSLVFLDPLETHEAGPPVLENPHIIVLPDMGFALGDIDPSRVSAALEFVVGMRGPTDDLTPVVLPEPGDPASQPWPVAVLGATPDGMRMKLDLTVEPRLDLLMPGARVLEVTAAVNGKAIGVDRAALMLVPTITNATRSGAVGSKRTITLTTRHAGPDTAVFIGGRVDPADVTVVSPRQVKAVLQAGNTVTGPVDIVLRSGQVAGPRYVGLTL
jgi:hypothetical protein